MNEGIHLDLDTWIVPGQMHGWWVTLHLPTGLPLTSCPPPHASLRSYLYTFAEFFSRYHRLWAYMQLGALHKNMTLVFATEGGCLPIHC